MTRRFAFPIEYLVVHHSATGRHVTRAQIDRWHRDKGWSGVGYHFVIEGDGAVRPGRAVPLLGAHAAGANQTSLGICVVGHNGLPESRWDIVQWKALRELLQALRRVWPAAQVVAHSEVGTTATECCGMSGDELRDRLAL